MVLNNISFPSNIQSTIGKYDVVKTTFQSNEMIVGKVLNVNVALWTNSVLNTKQDAYYVTIPSSGSVPMILVQPNVWKNHEVFLNVIDSKTVEVEVRYLNIADLNGFIGAVGSPNYADVFERSFTGAPSVYDTGKNIAIQAEINNVVARANIQANNNYFCDRDFSFDINGFNPSEDLVVKFSSVDPISQSYFAGFYREDTINNYSGVVQSLGLSYAEINSGVSLVDNLPNTCIIAGQNIQYVNNLSKGEFTVNKNCLNVSGTYRAYVVYKHLGQWHSCISDALKATASDKPIIVPILAYLSTDSSGNTYIDGCLKNVPSAGIMEMCTIINIADFNTKIAANGYSGTFSDYFSGLTAQIGGVGLPYTFNQTTGEICANVNTDNISGEQTLTFNLVMNYGDHTDSYDLQMKIQVVSNEIELVGTFTQGGQSVEAICKGDGDVTVNFNTIPGDLTHLFGNGGYYTTNGILSSSNSSVTIDDAFIVHDSENCIQIIKTDPETGGEDCECPECPNNVTVQLFQYTCFLDNSFQAIISGITPNGGAINWTEVINGGLSGNSGQILISGNNITEAIPFTTSDPTVSYIYEIFVNDANGCSYSGYSSIINTTNGDINAGCAANETVFLTRETVYQDCECPDEPDPLVCENYPAITYDCDPETQTIAASSSGTLGSAVTSDVLESSTDGVNYSSFGGSVTGQSVLHLRRTVKFSDGCPDIQVNETVFCNKVELCDNSLLVEYTLTPTLLTITQTENLNSPIQNDTMLLVSIDSGVTFVEYTTPIVLTGGEEIIIKRNIDFADNCNPINVLYTDVNNQTGTCDYTEYELECNYNESTTLFSATFTGNQSVLSLNDKKYSIDGGNSYSPYTGSVSGANMFLLVWTIQYEGCEKEILIKACCKPPSTVMGEDCIKVCIEDPIQVVFPDTPIQVCIVECCEGFEPLIECIEQVLTVTNAPAGATITWTGPNGFTATGNGIAITDEGTYFATITDNSVSPPCISTGSYLFEMPEAGTPISNPIIIT